MQLSDDPADLTWVRWYWCQPDAKPMPFFHAFCSPKWEDDEVFPPLGAHVRTRRREFRASADSPYPGQHVEGLQEWFEDGLPLSERDHAPTGDHCGVETWGTTVVVNGWYIVAEDDFLLFARGGQRQGGAATFSAAGGLTAAGGQRQGGTAPQFSRYVLLPHGGQRQGGSALGPSGYVLAPVGGQAQGGAAPTSSGYLLAPVGGQAQGGNAPTSSGYLLAPVGGQAQGGNAPQTSGYVLAPDGGQVQGGSADMPYVAEGGQVQGGATGQHGGYDLVADGGQVQGGAAHAGAGLLFGGTLGTFAPISAGNFGVGHPSGVAAGDLLVLVAEQQGSTPGFASIPAGFTRLNNASRAAGFFDVVAYKVATGSEPTTYSFPTAGASSYSYAMTLIKNASGAAPNFAVGTGGTGTNTATAPSATLATGPNVSLLVFFNSVAQSTGTIAGYTQDAAFGSAPWGRAFHKAVNGPGSTGNQSVTIGTLATYCGTQVTVS